MAEQTDWHERGCSRSCRNEHTRVWGWCDLAEEPKAELNLHISKAFTASDGNTSVSIRQATVEEAEAELAKFRPAPDWADLREMARNAGWTRHRLARDWTVWTDKESSVHIRQRPGGGWKVSLIGEFGDLAFHDPASARILAAARLVGLIGGAS